MSKPLALGAAAWLACSAACREPAPSRPADAPQRAALAFAGLDATELDGARVVRRVRAAQLLVVPKRFGFLEVLGLHELVLTQARFEVFLGAVRADAARGGVPRSLFAVGLLGGRAGVASASMYGVECVVRRGDEPVTRIDAERGAADLRTGDVALRRFRMTHLATGRTLTAERATWSAAEGQFVIAGEWSLASDERGRAGRGLRVAVDFSGAEDAPPATPRP